MEILLFISFFLFALIFFVVGKDDFGRKQRVAKEEPKVESKDEVKVEANEEAKVEAPVAQPAGCSSSTCRPHPQSCL